MINSPIRWVGGKSRLRKQIVALLPPHTCYVEPFAGAAWVLFAKPPSDVEVLNDVDQELVSFFRVVRDKPDELIASFDWTLVARAEFRRMAALDPLQLSDVQRAHRFYYLIMAGWGGEMDYPRFQTAITDGGHGNRLIGAMNHLRERLRPVYERLTSVIIECLDWRKCIDRYDRPGTVMYLDPPYPGNGCNYAHNMRGWGEHAELAERLGAARCQWVLSAYDARETRDLYAPFSFMPVKFASGMRTAKHSHTRTLNREVLIANLDWRRSAGC